MLNSVHRVRSIGARAMAGVAAVVRSQVRAPRPNADVFPMGVDPELRRWQIDMLSINWARNSTKRKRLPHERVHCRSMPV